MIHQLGKDSLTEIHPSLSAFEDQPGSKAAGPSFAEGSPN